MLLVSLGTSLSFAEPNQGTPATVQSQLEIILKKLDQIDKRQQELAENNQQILKELEVLKIRVRR